MRLTKTMFFMTALLLSCLLTGCGGGGGSTVDTTAPTITSAEMVPPEISFPSGSVTVRTVATDDTSISSVVLNITNSLTGVVVPHTLAKTTGNIYEANITVSYTGVAPAEQTYTFYVVVTDAAGNTKTQYAGRVIFRPELPPSL